MKNLKTNLQAISKELKALMNKVEKLGKALDKAAKTAISSKTTKKKPAPKKAAAKKTPAKKKPAPKKPAPKKAAPKKASAAPTAIDTVVDIIKKSKKGVDVETLIKKTGFDAKKISNLVYKAKKRGDIKSGAKGVYVKK